MYGCYDVDFSEKNKLAYISKITKSYDGYKYKYEVYHLHLGVNFYIHSNVTYGLGDRMVVDFKKANKDN